tara:strand:- start:4164 stop:4547 length:384 start_codon:yes stop_codon:yes gene_type:complete
MHFISDANTERLEAIEDELVELNDRRDAQHEKRTERLFDLYGGDPSKLFEDRPPQALQLASGDAEDETALQLADDVEVEISEIQEKLDLIGPPEHGLFKKAWAATKAYRQHLNTRDADNSHEDESED